MTLSSSRTDTQKPKETMATTVLSSVDLVRLVCAFQRGLFEDTKALLLTMQRESDLEWSQADRDMERLHRVLEPWHCRFDLSRLELLRHCRSYRSLVENVVQEAVYYGRSAIIRAIDVSVLQSIRIPLVDLAALGGRMDMLRYLHEISHAGYSHQAVNWAAVKGDVDILAFLLHHYDIKATDMALHHAVEHRHLNAATLLWNHGYRSCSSETVLAVVKRGTVEMLEWLHLHMPHNVNFPPDTIDTMHMAAFHGRLDMVEWLHHNRKEGCTSAAMDLAARGGHLQVVQWLHRHRMEGCSVRAMDWAAECGHVHVLDWLHANRSEKCSGDALAKALRHQQWAAVDWLRAHYSDLSCANAMVQALSTDDLTTLHWLNQHYSTDMAWISAMDTAAIYNSMNAMTWLHEIRPEGCTTAAMDYALAFGHWTLVTWMHSNRKEGCSVHAAIRAARTGNLVCLEWLHANQPNCWSSAAMDAAAAAGRIDILEWLHANRAEGCSPKAMVYAAAEGKLAVLQWLHGHQVEGWSTDVMDAAGTAGRMEILKWLHVNRQEGCTAAALSGASKNGWSAAVAWLLKHHREICAELLDDGEE
ncbi:hypothetical protein LEN26_019356 [Aphanomyces euteiches]|nr:hypothetical protein LEN26_019356 [Aphanomyces euteiches]